MFLDAMLQNKIKFFEQLSHSKSEREMVNVNDHNKHVNNLIDMSQSNCAEIKEIGSQSSQDSNDGKLEILNKTKEIVVGSSDKSVSEYNVKAEKNGTGMGKLGNPRSGKYFHVVDKTYSDESSLYTFLPKINNKGTTDRGHSSEKPCKYTAEETLKINEDMHQKRVEIVPGSIRSLREKFEKAGLIGYQKDVSDQKCNRKNITRSKSEIRTGFDHCQTKHLEEPDVTASHTTITVTSHDESNPIEHRVGSEENLYENLVEYRQKWLQPNDYKDRITSTGTDDSGVSSIRGSFTIYSSSSHDCLADVLDDPTYDEIFYDECRPLPIPTDSKSRLEYLREELIHTEELYIAGLEKAIYEYKPFIEISTPRSLMDKLPFLLGDMEEICRHSKEFLALLYETNDTEDVAASFLMSRMLFELYPEYARNKPYSDAYIKEFDDIIRVKQRQMDDPLGLSSYLLTPIQRLGKYLMLLGNMLDNAEKQGTFSKNLTAALQLVKGIMARSNDLVAIDSIKGCPVDLTQQGCFRMRESFTFISPMQFEGALFLFRNILVITTNSPETEEPEKFFYVSSIDMTDLGIDAVDKKERTFILYSYDKVKEGRSHVFHLKAATLKIKLYWVEILQHVLWEQFKQAKNNSNGRQNQKYVSESTRHYVQSTRPLLKILHAEKNNRKSKFSPTNLETWSFNSLKRFVKDKLPTQLINVKP